MLSNYISINDMVLLGRITKIPSYQFNIDIINNNTTITSLKMRDTSVELIELYSRSQFLINPFSENIYDMLVYDEFTPRYQLMTKISVLVIDTVSTRTIIWRLYYHTGTVFKDLSKIVLKKVNDNYYIDINNPTHYIKTSDGSCVRLQYPIAIEITRYRNIIREISQHTNNMKEAIDMKERYLISS